MEILKNGRERIRKKIMSSAENMGFFKGGKNPSTQASMKVEEFTSQEGRCRKHMLGSHEAYVPKLYLSKVYNVIILYTCKMG